MKIEIIFQIFCIIPVQDSFDLLLYRNVKESSWSDSSLLRKVSLVRIQYGSPKHACFLVFKILIFIKGVNFNRHCVQSVYRIVYEKRGRVIVFKNEKVSSDPGSGFVVVQY